MRAGTNSRLTQLEIIPQTDKIEFCCLEQRQSYMKQRKTMNIIQLMNFVLKNANSMKAKKIIPK